MPYFKGKLIKKDGYCRCEQPQAVTTESEEFGYWDVCCTCRRPLEDGYHAFNHYDGEYHDEDELLN